MRQIIARKKTEKDIRTIKADMVQNTMNTEKNL